MTVRIRGLYSSALTKLLSTNKIKIANPSDNVRNSFKKLKFGEEYNTIVHDLMDKNGIIIKGEESDKIHKIIIDNMPGVAIQKRESGHIYVGKIIRLDPGSKNIHVDLGLKKIGLLPLKDYWGYVKEGEKVLVQLKSEEKDCFILSTKMHLFGTNVVLIQKGFTKMSKNIKSREELNRLNKITEEACEEGWGVLWKTSAQNKDDKELKKEIKELFKNYEKLKSLFEKETKIKLISKGLTTVIVRFDKTAKEILDKLRRKVKPTIENHHRYKTDNFSSLVDFSENLIKSGVNEKKINTSIKDYINEKQPRENDVHLIVEYILNGSTKFLKGKIVKKDDNSLVIKRFMKSGGVYEGLNTSIERGDYALTEVKENEQFTKHSFYSTNDELKGELFTINTPLELQTNRAVSIKLEMGVVKTSEGTEIINEELIKEYAQQGAINKKLISKIKKIAKKLGDVKK